MYFHHVQFFTATVLKWIPLLRRDKYKDKILDSMNFLVREGRCDIYGFVIMPNHVHLIWKINESHKREDVQRDFLKYTGQQIRFDLLTTDTNLLRRFKVNLSDRKYQFWQRKPLSVDLNGREVIEQKLDYIHRNPVMGKWKLVDDYVRYKYSSASFYEEDTRDFKFLKHYMEYFQ